MGDDLGTSFPVMALYALTREVTAQDLSIEQLPQFLSEVAQQVMGLQLCEVDKHWLLAQGSWAQRTYLGLQIFRGSIPSILEGLTMKPYSVGRRCSSGGPHLEHPSLRGISSCIGGMSWVGQLCCFLVVPDLSISGHMARGDTSLGAAHSGQPTTVSHMFWRPPVWPWDMCLGPGLSIPLGAHLDCP